MLNNQRNKPAQQGEDRLASFKLAYLPPYDWPSMIRFLKKRATPGVEFVTETGCYIRSIQFGNDCGLINVENDHDHHQLTCRIDFPNPALTATIIKKVKRLFDLDTDMSVVLNTLRKDPILWSIARKSPGLRVPGCWDGFEIAVRAIVGQQVSVVAATTVMGKIIQSYGLKYACQDNISHLFPAAKMLTNINTQSMPMPQSRAQTIVRLAQSVSCGDIDFDSTADTEQITEKLLTIKGIGPWTAQYIAMRAFANPDALLKGDLVLEKNAAKLYAMGDRLSTRQLLDRAQQWRPWRAYAAMHIWNIN